MTRYRVRTAVTLLADGDDEKGERRLSLAGKWCTYDSEADPLDARQVYLDAVGDDSGALSIPTEWGHAIIPSREVRYVLMEVEEIEPEEMEADEGLPG